MTQKISAGIVLYRVRSGLLEIFLVHPGGPFWAKKDQGAWSIPKGEIEEGEDALQAARREFGEETGSQIDGAFIELTRLRQRSGKIVYAWAVEGNIDALSVRSNTFSMEWPHGSGVRREFPEIDRAAWFAAPQAVEKLLPGQRAFVAELQAKLALA